MSIKFFDELGKIAYEPVKLLSDALRQPLKNMDAKNEREKMQLESAIRKAEEQLKIQLYKDKLNAETENEIKKTKLRAELDIWIQEKNIESREKYIEAMKKYQTELSQAASQMQKTVGDMNLEMRERAFSLFSKISGFLLKIKNDEMDYMENKMLSAIEKFPEGKARDLMLDTISKGCETIIEKTANFIESLNQDFQRLNMSIDKDKQDAKDMIRAYLGSGSFSIIKGLDNNINGMQ